MAACPCTKHVCKIDGPYSVQIVNEHQTFVLPPTRDPAYVYTPVVYPTPTPTSPAPSLHTLCTWTEATECAMDAADLVPMANLSLPAEALLQKQ